MPLRVAINGFGRIGEIVYRIASEEARDLEVVAINDIVPLDQIAYLLRFDSVHRGEAIDVECGPGWLRADGREVKVYQERDPADLPWGELGVDAVVECTGVFRDREGLGRHLAAGARRVLLSAPAKAAEDVDLTVCLGVNDELLDPERHVLVSNASCTTNCLAPVLRCVDEAFGVDWAMMSTVHAYTGSQALIDEANKKMRRGRAAAWNIVPASTGAAKAIGLVLPHLDGKVDGMAFRVPVPDGSVVDLVVGTREPLSRDALHGAFRDAEADPRYRGVLSITEHEIVSSDILGSARSSVVDAPSTLVQGERRAKIVAWYDNEWGYASRVVDLLERFAG